MTAPWLSVAMPVHCGARDLPATLASAAAERPQGVEFLVYDSSPDHACGEIVAHYADRLNVRYITTPELRGWPDKTNRAMHDAAAPHVTLLHQDDLWLPGHVEAIRDSITASPHAVMHVASSRLIDEQGADIGHWATPLVTGTWSGKAFGQRLIVQNFLAIPAPVIRRDAWLTVGGMDPALWYTADWDLYLKLAALGNVAVRPHTTTAFRIHGSSLTMTGSRDARDMREQLDIVLERHGAFFGLATDRRLRARAEASAAINCGLAQVAAGRPASLIAALLRLLGLGPVDAWLYLRDSRLINRLAPRLRLRMTGAL